MSRSIGIVHYWGGCPQTPNSKWREFLHILQRCSEQGWRTFLVWSHMPTDTNLSKPFTDMGCKIVVLPRPTRNFDLGCVLRTYQLLRAAGCDVFHCHNVHTSPLIGARLAGVPIRIWSKLAMSPYYERGTVPCGLHRLQPSTRVSSMLAHRILCISSAVRDEMCIQAAPEEKLLVAPISIDANHYTEMSGAEVRSELGLSEAHILISTVGYAAPVKGWDLLIQAFAQVVKVARHARLVLVGSTDRPDEIETAAQLRSLVDKLGLKDTVRFLGQRKDVSRILAASDVFVLPSRSEGLGYALLEALAAGVPSVSARVGGIPDVIVHRENGLLFDREDVNGLADTLIELLRDSNLRQRLGISGRKRVQQFDLDATTDRMFNLYEELFANAKLTNRKLQKRLCV